MRSWIFGAAACSLALIPLPELRQDQAPPAQAERLVLEPGPVALGRLIEDSGRFLGKTYLGLAEQERQATFQLGQRLELDREACEALLSRVLYVHGFGLSPVDAQRQIYEWISLASPRRQELKTTAAFVAPEQVGQGPKRVVLTMVPLRNINSQQASNTLRPLFTDPQGFCQIQAVGDSQALVIVGFNDWVAQVVRMLAAVDSIEEGPARVSQKRLAELQALVDRLAARVQALEKARKE